MINSRGHLSAESLDLLLLQALKPDDQKSVQSHLQTCAECTGRWKDLAEDSQKFQQFVFPRTVAKVEARLIPVSIFERFKLAFVVPAFGIAAAIAIGFVISKPVAAVEGDNYIGMKGAQPGFEVFALRNGTQLFKVHEGDALKAGDKIRFIVVPGSAKYLLIGAQDAKGEFAVFHPYGSDKSVGLEPSGPRRIELPDSVELDDSVGQERLVAVFSETPVTADAVKAAVTADSKAPAIAGARVISWEYLKEAK